jgi:hypothetical protein
MISLFDYVGCVHKKSIKDDGCRSCEKYVNCKLRLRHVCLDTCNLAICASKQAITLAARCVEAAERCHQAARKSCRAQSARRASLFIKLSGFV